MLSNESQPHIEVESVEAVYESASAPLAALKGIDLAVGRGEFVSIIGPSGCGKSTLLRIIGGLQAPTRGRVLIDGRPPLDAQREKSIGFVFQDPSLLPWRKVIDNVKLPLQVNKRPRGLEPGRLVDLVGLGGFHDYYPHQLSGGMQQRVAIARSLVTSPSLLLMDEPFGALDEITRASMRFELLRVWRASETAGAQRLTVLFVTHSISEALLLSDRVVVMTPQPGRIAGILDVHLPRPRDEELEFDPAFVEQARRLRSMLAERSLV
jgi:NitT/TauT family transport system ATP-binding protein